MPKPAAISLKPFAITAALLFLVISAAFGQQQAQPQKAPSPGITPTAPPPIAGVHSLVSTCTIVEQGGVQKQGTLSFQPVANAVGGGSSYSLMCISPGEYGQMQPNFTSVWTAQESQAQFTFLRAEVKSTIENAVTDKIVNSATLQDAVIQALQDDQRLRAAVIAVLKQEMDNIDTAIVADVLAKLKAQQANPQTPVAKKPQ